MSSQAPNSILVLGVGELGAAILSNLIAHPQLGSTRVTVLKRTPEPPTLQVPDSSNLEILTADITTISEVDLTTLFTPFDTIISCNGMFLPPSTQLKIARSVLAAKVPRYFPWQFGADYDLIGPNSSQDLFTTQLEVRALLRAQSQTRWVIVSTGMFTSFLFEPGFGLVNEERTKVCGIGSWENRITVTAPWDIGRVVAELVLVHFEARGVVYTAGDTVSMARLADVVEKVMGKEVEREIKDVEVLKRELMQEPEDGMRKYRVVFGEGVGVAWDKSLTFNAKHGMELESVDDWAEKTLRG